MCMHKHNTHVIGQKNIIVALFVPSLATEFIKIDVHQRRNPKMIAGKKGEEETKLNTFGGDNRAESEYN